jgi:hypothetical protein
MTDLNQREQAQLGLQYIEDAVVNLLVRHPEGLKQGQIADVLGLSTDLSAAHREMIAGGVLELLVGSGRILWDGARGAYIDNPARY